MEVEHIGIAVKNLEEARKIYESLFPEIEYALNTYPELESRILIIYAENIKIELLEPLNSDSPIGKYIAKRGEGIHHIAYLVEDLDRQIDELRDKGFTLLTGTHYKGAEEYNVIFVQPKETGYVLTEFCQKSSQE